MADMLTWFVGRISLLFSWLNSLNIVSGVSVLGFLGGFALIVVLVRNLVPSAK